MVPKSKSYLDLLKNLHTSPFGGAEYESDNGI